MVAGILFSAAVGVFTTWVLWPSRPSLPYLPPRFDQPREINTAALALALRRGGK